MTEPIVIIGCGGFGREVHDVIDAINTMSPRWELLGYLDDSPTDEKRLLVENRGSRIIGPLSTITSLPRASAVIGIGTGLVRRSIDQILIANGWDSATLVHPSASRGFDVRLAPGTVICAGARLTTNIRLGRHVHVNINSTIGHDVVLDDYVTVNPLVAVSGWVEVGSASMLGTSSAVLQRLTLGERVIVGAGAVVTRDVPPDTTVKGIPAR